MKATLKAIGGMKLEAAADGHSIVLDAKTPIGTGTAMTPKELLLAGLGGCTAMDVLALLKKHKQTYESMDVDVDVTTSTGGSPVVFTQRTVTFQVLGPVEPAILLDAVRLSQTKYCGVSAMLTKAFPIRYDVILNGERIGGGNSEFGG